MVQRNYGGDPKVFSNTVIDIPILKEGVKSYTYKVKSLGFSGNVSKPSDTVTVNVDSIHKLPNTVSTNCTYTLYPMPHEKYNDSNLTKITDGKYSSVNSVKDKNFAGWYNDPLDVTIDLGKVTPVQQFMVSYLRDPIPWSELPDEASISISQDGINYTPVGSIRIPSVPFSDRYGSKYPLYLTLDTPINARYVRLFSVTKSNHYTFIDEFEVRN